MTNAMAPITNPIVRILNVVRTVSIITVCGEAKFESGGSGRDDIIEGIILTPISTKTDPIINDVIKTTIL